jgi:acyl carrier protein
MNKDNKKRKLALGAVMAAGVTTGAMAATPSPDAPKQDVKPDVELTAADVVRIDGQDVDFDNLMAQLPPQVRDDRIKLMYGVRKPRVYGGPVRPTMYGGPRFPKKDSINAPDTIYSRVINLVAKEAKTNNWKVKPMSNLRTDLGLDSLGVKNLLVAVEEKFNVVIPEETVNSIETVRDIINFLRKENARKDEIQVESQDDIQEGTIIELLDD